MGRWDIKTPETHPNHPVVGHFYAGHDLDTENWEAAYWYCDSYDPRQGFWLTRTDNPERRINVSEAAINRTFHEIHYWAEKDWFYCPWLRSPVDRAKLGEYIDKAKEF